jgi:hypothetical protein
MPGGGSPPATRSLARSPPAPATINSCKLIPRAFYYVHLTFCTNQWARHVHNSSYFCASVGYVMRRNNNCDFTLHRRIKSVTDKMYERGAAAT